MNIAILGGAGFIGSRLASMAGAGHTVQVFDKAIDGSDLTTLPGWGGVDQWKPDAIVNVVANLANRDTAIIALRLTDVAEAWVTRGYHPHVVHLSSAAVYGEPIAREPFSEGDFPRGRFSTSVSLYGLDKQVAERYLQRVSHWLPVTVIRPANVYGPGQVGNVVALFEREIKAGRPPVINRSAAVTRDFVHVDDLCRAILLCLDARPAPGSYACYNVGTGIGTTLGELAAMMQENLGGLPFVLNSTGDPGILWSVLSFAAIQQRLGWSPTISLQRGLDDLYASLADARLADAAEQRLTFLYSDGPEVIPLGLEYPANHEDGGHADWVRRMAAYYDSPLLEGKTVATVCDRCSKPISDFDAVHLGKRGEELHWDGCERGYHIVVNDCLTVN